MPRLELILRVVKEWVDKAERDWLTASHLRTLQKDFAIDAMGFHAQQCAEKYLKSLLVLHLVPVPKTHDISTLVRLLPQGMESRMCGEDLEFLASFAVDIRYPGPGPVEYEEAERAVAIAGKIREHVRTQLPLEVVEIVASD